MEWVDRGGESFPAEVFSPYDPLEDGLPCVGCEQWVAEERRWPRLYCTDYCASVAAAVRYRRQKENEHFLERPDAADVLNAIRTQEGFVIAGVAYRRRVTPKQRDAVFTAKGRLCESCGAPATDIDHIDRTDRADLDNLRPLCQACHLGKTIGDMYHQATAADASASRASLEAMTSSEVIEAARRSGIPLTVVRADEQLQRYATYLQRVYAKLPRICDDEERWIDVWRDVASNPEMRLPRWWDQTNHLRADGLSSEAAT